MDSMLKLDLHDIFRKEYRYYSILIAFLPVPAVEWAGDWSKWHSCFLKLHFLACGCQGIQILFAILPHLQ